MRQRANEPRATDLYYLSVSTTPSIFQMSDLSLVSLEPSGTLVLNLERGIQAKAILNVTNVSKSRIAFKVKTTQPSWYNVRPNQQILDVGKTEEVSIILIDTECNLDQLAMNQEEKTGKHRFLVQSKVIEDSVYERLSKLDPAARADELTKIWEGSKDDRKNIKLKVEFRHNGQATSISSTRPTGDEDLRSSLARSNHTKDNGTTNATPKATDMSKAGASGTGDANELDKEGPKSTCPSVVQISTKMIQEISLQIENEKQSLMGVGEGISEQLHAALHGVNSETLELASLLKEFEDKAQRFCVTKRCLPAADSNGKEKEKLLTLNVGGTEITISYDLILSAGRQCGLLGVLLHPRWRSFMVRDREGNIFLDFDAEWLQPILDSMQSNQLDPKPSFLDHLVLPSLVTIQAGFGTLSDFFRLGTPRYSDGLSALEIIMASKQASELWNFIRVNYNKATIRYVKEVDTPINAMPTITSGVKHLLIGVGSARWIGFVTDQALLGSNPTSVNWFLYEGDNSPVKTFAGSVKLSSGFEYYMYNTYYYFVEISSNPTGYPPTCNYNYNTYNSASYPIEKWVVYELSDQQNVHFDFEPEVEMFQSVDFNITDSPVIAGNSTSTASESLPKIDLGAYINQCVSRINRLSSLGKVIEQIQRAVANNRSKILDEILFVENYVLSVYEFPAVPKPNEDELRQGEPSLNTGVGIPQIADALKRLEKLLPAVCAQNRANLSLRTDISSIDQSQVVYFNVSGSQICANRKALLQAFPNSQLATRISNRWDEQADTLDREGSRIYNLPYGAFKAIINAVRTSALNRSPPKVRLNSIQVQQVKAVIGYLMISDLPVEIVN
eukprot:gene11198-12486_t